MQTTLSALQVIGVTWLDGQALVVVSEQGPRTLLDLFDASGMTRTETESETGLGTGLNVLLCHKSEAAVRYYALLKLAH